MAPTRTAPHTDGPRGGDRGGLRTVTATDATRRGRCATGPAGAGVAVRDRGTPRRGRAAGRAPGEPDGRWRGDCWARVSRRCSPRPWLPAAPGPPGTTPTST